LPVHAWKSNRFDSPTLKSDTQAWAQASSVFHVCTVHTGRGPRLLVPLAWPTSRVNPASYWTSNCRESGPSAWDLDGGGGGGGGSKSPSKNYEMLQGYSSQNIKRMIKLSRMRWAGHVANSLLLLFMLMGWDYVSELRPPTGPLFIHMMMYENGEPWCNDIGSATLSTTNPTWADMSANPGLRGERPATNRLSHGTVLRS
jgi:hypothetical protein